MRTPLAEQLRPKTFDEVVGQDHLLGPDGFLTRVIAEGEPRSIILWGPPGCGKTTLARLYARAFKARMVSFSAVFSGIADLRKVIKETKDSPLFRTVLFVDEIHRFNKAQQDGFLPFVEDGTITLVGATTENPSFALNDALLSRAQVLQLNPLDDQALDKLITRAGLDLEPDQRTALIQAAQGDGRYLLNLIETDPTRPTPRPALYDRAADSHYNLISALHKSVRGSDSDAALYWLCRMLEGGEDPLFLARRLIRIASEDIGLADPQALPLAIAARDAYQQLGSPEGELALAQLTIYLSLAPKSRATNDAYDKARALAKRTTQHAPPLHILNAPTPLMKSLGYGAPSDASYFPKDIPPATFYTPLPRGFEREMQKRLTYFQNLRTGKES
jgi:putative ATPase